VEAGSQYWWIKWGEGTSTARTPSGAVRRRAISLLTSREEQMSDTGYKIAGAILVAALLVDFIWVIRTALSVH
jgi:hypothetical protein